MGMGGGNAIVPNFNTQNNTAFRPSNPTLSAVPTPSRAVQIPAWMTARPAYPGYGPQQTPANINPGMPGTPTSSFLAADGDVAQGINGGAMQTSIPTGSVLAADGQAVLGPNGSQAYWPWMPAGVNTFIAAGGQAVRGPEGSIDPSMDTGYGGGGGGFGTSYRGWGGRGGRGGGGWGDYGSSPAWTTNDPAYMNLYSWNYKG